MSSRDILIKITEDSQRRATWVEVVLPELEEEGTIFIPEFTTFPEKGRVRVSFNTYGMRVRVKRVPELTLGAVDEEGEYDKWTQLDIQNWFELTDKQTPEPWTPKSWLPHFYRWSDGRGHITDAFEIYPIGADPRDPTQALYIFDPDAEHPPVVVEPWTVHLPATWIIKAASIVHPPEWAVISDGEDIGFNVGALQTFWRERCRAEAEQAEQDAEYEAQKGLNEAEAEARDRAEEEEAERNLAFGPSRFGPDEEEAKKT